MTEQWQIIFPPCYESCVVNAKPAHSTNPVFFLLSILLYPLYKILNEAPPTMPDILESININ